MASQCIDRTLTAAQIREALDYDPAGGAFTWRVRPSEHFRNARGWNTFNSRYSGKPAGCVTPPQGYFKIRLNNALFRADRLAWIIMIGTWPPNDVDHIDGNTSNDRWVNLRSATRSQNNMNRRRRINTASVFKGITWDKRASKWIAQIKVEGKHLHLGTFETEELAHAAYCEAATRHFGEFARFS